MTMQFMAFVREADRTRLGEENSAPDLVFKLASLLRESRLRQTEQLTGS